VTPECAETPKPPPQGHPHPAAEGREPGRGLALPSPGTGVAGEGRAVGGAGMVELGFCRREGNAVKSTERELKKTETKERGGEKEDAGRRRGEERRRDSRGLQGVNFLTER